MHSRLPRATRHPSLQEYTGRASGLRRSSQAFCSTLGTRVDATWRARRVGGHSRWRQRSYGDPVLFTAAGLEKGTSLVVPGDGLELEVIPVPLAPTIQVLLTIQNFARRTNSLPALLSRILASAPLR